LNLVSVLNNQQPFFNRNLIDDGVDQRGFSRESEFISWTPTNRICGAMPSVPQLITAVVDLGKVIGGLNRRLDW
jgi:hypothetical protein